MIAGLVGRLMQALAHLRGGPAAADLGTVGGELRRLEARRAQRRRISS